MSREEFLSRYTYDAKRDHLGSGGYASVFKAYDSVLNREVAIKVAPFKPGIRSLVDEFDAIKHLSHHRNISNYENVYRYKLETGIFEFAVMQYYPMGSGKSLISSKLMIDDRIIIANGLISGVNYLHQQKVIHRDLKWSNVLISQNQNTKEYVPKIADFGLSKRVEEESGALIDNSVNAGTYSYLSPENFKSYRDKQNKALKEKIKYNYDLWAVGIMLYELFVGEVPFPLAKDESNANIARVNQIKAIVESDIPDEINSIPEPYKLIIQKCLIKNPFDRINSARLIMEMAGLNESTFGNTANNKHREVDDDKTILDVVDRIHTDNKKGGAETKKSIKSIIAGASILLLLILVFGVAQIRGGVSNLFGSHESTNSVDEPLMESINPAQHLAEEYFEAFTNDFNNSLGKTSKHKIYTERKDSLFLFLTDSSNIIEEDIKVDLESIIMKHINLLSKLELVKIKSNNDGKIDYIIFK